MSAHLTKPVISLRVGTTSTQVGLHMSAPWNPNNIDTNDALEIRGSIRLRSGTPDELLPFQFGFVQFIRLLFLSLRYHGRKAEEGHVLIDAQVEVGTDLMLDLNRRAGGRSPFYQRPFSSVVGGVIETAMQDHPSLVVSQTLHNFRTGFDNHLEHASERLEAVSILTAQQPNGQFRIFGHVQWSLLYDAAFFWQDQQIKVKLDNSKFDSGIVFMRPPRDSDLRGVSALLQKLGPSMAPVFNDRLQAASGACSPRSTSPGSTATRATPRSSRRSGSDPRLLPRPWRRTSPSRRRRAAGRPWSGARAFHREIPCTLRPATSWEPPSARRPHRPCEGQSASIPWKVIGYHRGVFTSRPEDTRWQPT